MAVTFCGHDDGLNQSVGSRFDFPKCFRVLYDDENSVWRINGKRKATAVITDAGRAAVAEADGKKPEAALPAAPQEDSAAELKPKPRPVATRIARSQPYPGAYGVSTLKRPKTAVAPASVFTRPKRSPNRPQGSRRRRCPTGLR